MLVLRINILEPDFQADKNRNDVTNISQKWGYSLKCQTDMVNVYTTFAVCYDLSVVHYIRSNQIVAPEFSNIKFLWGEMSIYCKHFVSHSLCDICANIFTVYEVCLSEIKIGCLVSGISGDHRSAITMQ